MPRSLQVTAHHPDVRRGDALAGQVVEAASVPAGPANRKRERPKPSGGLLGLGAGVEQQVAPGDADVEADLVKTFEELWAELSDKAADPARRAPAPCAALDAGVHAIGKKLVEEAAESWMAAEHEGQERAAEEISQLLYHAQVLMLATGLSLDDVYAHL